MKERRTTMSCCGKQRGQIGPTSTFGSSLGSPERAPSGGARPAAHRFTVDFEYLGNTSLTAVGSVTGRRYQFDSRVVRIVAVDVRDRDALAGVPNLREIRNGRW
jgi:hypothetical protein